MDYLLRVFFVAATLFVFSDKLYLPFNTGFGYVLEVFVRVPCLSDECLLSDEQRWTHWLIDFDERSSTILDKLYKYLKANQLQSVNYFSVDEQYHVTPLLFGRIGSMIVNDVGIGCVKLNVKNTNLFLSLTMMQQTYDQLKLILDRDHLIKVGWYNVYMYTPLQIHLPPYIAKIPRFAHLGTNSITVFNANIVTYSRTLLIIPIAWLLKYDHNIWACLLILLHDLLDHVDDIVAKTQTRIYGEIDDPLLNGFMHTFCDKIVSIFCLWTILLETNFSQTSYFQTMVVICLCCTIIGVEIVTGIVRVQEYFHASLSGHQQLSGTDTTAAAMEGKLKKKLESMGLAFLCLSTGYATPFNHWSGIMGVICCSLTVRFAYVSLTEKLRAREKIISIINATKSSSESTASGRVMTLDSILGESKIKAKSLSNSANNSSKNAILNEKSLENHPVNHSATTMRQIKEKDEEMRELAVTRNASLPIIWIDGRADKVYTIGCFDLFHEGHRLLLLRMRQFGREVIVGVHDSHSIHKLKKRVPVDGTDQRMLNVKQHADQVYCIAGTDPSAFVKCIVHLKENESALYIRGDDMADFPSRHVVEGLMPVKFLPYTAGISSTKLRQERYSHIRSDDLEHLERIN
ncbi:unnamed protein product [Didymodactylos carnosus]|uniref:Cytidyltransferase-like domain-containing protein n=1 Tax=Didymodactylos carnosus TaxID=1234261 RepID=A0A813VHG2_9BILA|nr:unnamed protein product [Didymodactylos carnosus]CAF0838559.1 unnamed protein product [Didymodactylos carnosus]CAF3535198.1 unnamed protein product [Didymodactylos carnosus]CAF3625720.1 unnamed protein product [Didymodactylos carnosus]